ncbi:hypothetical protein BHM03_00011083 [Ensete ventricosum]|nr:hypothetical protein BHM03_00011083 [Ensete ventricosum]
MRVDFPRWEKESLGTWSLPLHSPPPRPLLRSMLSLHESKGSMTPRKSRLCGSMTTRSKHPGLAFRGMVNPLRERHHEDKQAKKNAATNLVVIKKLVRSGYCAGRRIEAQDLDNGAQILANTSESHGGDLIIQRYDRSDWRVGLLQCLYSLKGVRQVRGQGRNVEVLKQVVERD